jgi:hypothetical protein
VTLKQESRLSQNISPEEGRDSATVSLLSLTRDTVPYLVP